MDIKRRGKKPRLFYIYVYTTIIVYTHTYTHALIL